MALQVLAETKRNHVLDRNRETVVMSALVCEPNRGHQVVKKATEHGAQSASFFRKISSVYWRLQSI